MHLMSSVVAITTCLTFSVLPGRLHAAAAAGPQAATRDAALDKAVTVRRDSIKAELGSAAQKRLAGATQNVLAKLSQPAGVPDAASTARSAVTAAFQRLTPDQTSVLTFYVLAEIARMTTDADTLNKRAAPADQKGIHDLSKDQVARLLHLMDQGSPFAASLRKQLDSTASIPTSVVKDVH